MQFYIIIETFHCFYIYFDLQYSHFLGVKQFSRIEFRLLFKFKFKVYSLSSELKVLTEQNLKLKCFLEHELK